MILLLLAFLAPSRLIRPEAFIFLPRPGGIYELPSRESGIHEDHLSQCPVSSSVRET